MFAALLFQLEEMLIKCVLANVFSLSRVFAKLTTSFWTHFGILDQNVTAVLLNTQ